MEQAALPSTPKPPRKKPRCRICGLPRKGHPATYCPPRRNRKGQGGNNGGGDSSDDDGDGEESEYFDDDGDDNDLPRRSPPRRAYTAPVRAQRARTSVRARAPTRTGSARPQVRISRAAAQSVSTGRRGRSVPLPSVKEEPEQGSEDIHVCGVFFP